MDPHNREEAKVWNYNPRGSNLSASTLSRLSCILDDLAGLQLESRRRASSPAGKWHLTFEAGGVDRLKGAAVTAWIRTTHQQRSGWGENPATSVRVAQRGLQWAGTPVGGASPQLMTQQGALQTFYWDSNLLSSRSLPPSVTLLAFLPPCLSFYVFFPLSSPALIPFFFSTVVKSK